MSNLTLPSHSLYKTKDLALTSSGDLIIGPDGDFLTITGPAVLQQDIMFRLKTVLGDYVYFPECGTELQDLIGKPNSPSTASDGENTIIQALTHDGFISTDAITVTSYPIAEDTIVFHLVVDLEFFAYEGEFLSLMFQLDLKEGLIF